MKFKYYYTLFLFLIPFQVSQGADQMQPKQRLELKNIKDMVLRYPKTSITVGVFACLFMGSLCYNFRNSSNHNSISHHKKIAKHNGRKDFIDNNLRYEDLLLYLLVLVFSLLGTTQKGSKYKIKAETFSHTYIKRNPKIGFLIKVSFYLPMFFLLRVQIKDFYIAVRLLHNPKLQKNYTKKYIMGRLILSIFGFFWLSYSIWYVGLSLQ